MTAIISCCVTTLAFILLLLPMPARAVPAITCHCFTERSYKQEQPNAADPYFLASTQNSFFAQLFSVDKKTIVLKKQGGVSPDDLWISYWVGAKSGVLPERLLQAKQNDISWKETLTNQRIAPLSFSPRFSDALNAQASPLQLANIVVDELFHSHQLLADTEVAAMRQAGATSQELIIAALIAAKSGKPALQLFQEVNKGKKTWGSLLSFHQIDTKKMQREISIIMKLKPETGK